MFGTTTLSEPDIYEILANPRRLETLRHLTDTAGGRTVTLRDLSTELAIRETGETPPPAGIRESVYNSLHQTHLPKLDGLGIVRYDRDTRTVTLQANARDVDRYIGVISPLGIAWDEYYRILGVLGLVTVVMALADLPLVSAVDPLLYASGFLFLFATSVLYQFWTIRWHIRQFFG